MGGTYHFEELCYFSPFRICSTATSCTRPPYPYIRGKKCIKSSMLSSLHQCGLQGMRSPVFSQRFGCHSLYSSSHLKGSKECFGRWGAGVQISRCYYKCQCLPFYPFTSFYQVSRPRHFFTFINRTCFFVTRFVEARQFSLLSIAGALFFKECQGPWGAIQKKIHQDRTHKSQLVL